jgi:hypothetical protein
MDDHVSDFFCQASDEAPHGNFHRVVALHNAPETSFQEVALNVKDLCKGWHELAYLGTEDRIEFTRDFWLSKLPYEPNAHQSITKFFSQLDDIGIYLVQKKFDDPFESHMVYSLKGDKGFFQGLCSATDLEITQLQKRFPNHTIPKDYLAFLKIHNGFAKSTDTGVLSTSCIAIATEQFHAILSHGAPLETSIGTVIDPETLVPFYESFGMPVYQCFWSDWYPQQEMGNVYYSGFTHTISDVFGVETSIETLGFPTFLSWLTFYLETV